MSTAGIHSFVGLVLFAAWVTYVGYLFSRGWAWWLFWAAFGILVAATTVAPPWAVTVDLGLDNVRVGAKRGRYLIHWRMPNGSTICVIHWQYSPVQPWPVATWPRSPIQ